MTPHPDPRRPSGGLCGALVRSHLPGEQQQRGVQPAPALDPGRPDQRGGREYPPWPVVGVSPCSSHELERQAGLLRGEP